VNPDALSSLEREVIPQVSDGPFRSSLVLRLLRRGIVIGGDRIDSEVRSIHRSPCLCHLRYPFLALLSWRAGEFPEWLVWATKEKHPS
jgi:hypothetical protein